MSAGAAGACTKRQQRRQRRQHSVKRHEAAEARAGRTPEADNVDASDTGTKPLDTKQSPTAPKPDRSKVADVPDDGGRAVPLKENHGAETSTKVSKSCVWQDAGQYVYHPV